MAHLNCARCGLSVRSGRAYVGWDDCPRCLGRDEESVPLCPSPVPFRLLERRAGRAQVRRWPT